MIRPLLVSLALAVTLGAVTCEAVHSQGYYGYYRPPAHTAPYRLVYGTDTLQLRSRYSLYGSPYSHLSWRNQYTTSAPMLVDSEGNYRGRLSTNQYDPDSISNPYGRFGSEYSPDSINNEFGPGNPYAGTSLYVIPDE